MIINNEINLLIFRVPKVEVNLENEEFEISDDPESFTRLNTDNVPICITFTKVRK